MDIFDAIRLILSIMKLIVGIFTLIKNDENNRHGR